MSGGVDLSILFTLPPCGLQCIETAVTAGSACVAINGPCGCPDVFSNATSCILESCTIRQALSTENGTNVMCGIAPKVDHSGYPWIIVFTILPVLVVCLRFFARRVRTVMVWWDDLCIAISLASLVTLTGIIWAAYQKGLGRDLWSVPLDNISPVLMYYWLGTNLYTVGRMACRVSIFLFYFRILDKLPGRWIRYTLLTLDLVGQVATLFLGLLYCRPVHYWWDRWDGEHEGYCPSLVNEMYGIAANHIFWDILIISYPLPYIARLQLDPKKKILGLILFSVGLLVIAVSIARIFTFSAFSNSTNPLIDGLPLAIYSVVEVSLYIIVACLPSIAPLFKIQGSLFSVFSKLSSGFGSRKSSQGWSSAGYSGNYPLDESASRVTGEQKLRVVHTTTVSIDDTQNRPYVPLGHWRDGSNSATQLVHPQTLPSHPNNIYMGPVGQADAYVTQHGQRR